MEEGLRDLYQAIIQDHDERPRNYGVLPDAARSAEGYNPLCGDRYHVSAKVVDGVLEAVGFDGHGCALSRASASMMTAAVSGLTCDAAADFAAEVIAFLSTGETGPSDLGDLYALQGVHRIPTRRRCATLAWDALLRLLSPPLGEVQ